METGQQLQHLQEQLYTAQLSDDDQERMATYFYDLPEANPRRNKHVYPTGKTKSLRIVNLIELMEQSGLAFKAGSFVHPRTYLSLVLCRKPTFTDDGCTTAGSTRLPATTFVIADLDSESGLALVKEALLSMVPDSTEDNLSRFAFIHNPTSHRRNIQRSPSSLLAHLTATQSMQKATPAQLLHILGLAEVEVQAQQESSQIVIPQNTVLDELLGGVVMPGSGKEVFDQFSRSTRALVELLKLAPGEQALIVNGRVSLSCMACSGLTH